MDTEISTCLTDKWKARINQEGLYNKKVGAQIKGLGKMAKNQSLPAHLQEKYFRGKDNLTTYEHHEKPITWWPRPSLSNPRSTNDIVWAFSRANPTLLGSLRIVSLQDLLWNCCGHFIILILAFSISTLSLINLFFSLLVQKIVIFHVFAFFFFFWWCWYIQVISLLNFV